MTVTATSGRGGVRYHIREPLIAFYEAVMRREWTRLERGDPAGAWRNAQATFYSQVVGPHFEALCREWVLDAGGGAFGDWPGTVAAGAVTCYSGAGFDDDLGAEAHRDKLIQLVGLDTLYGVVVSSGPPAPETAGVREGAAYVPEQDLFLPNVRWLIPTRRLGQPGQGGPPTFQACP